MDSLASSMPGLIVIWLLVGGLSATLSATLMDDKGYSGTPGCIGGLLFGPLVLLFAVGLPDKNLRKQLDELIWLQRTALQPLQSPPWEMGPVDPDTHEIWIMKYGGNCYHERGCVSLVGKAPAEIKAMTLAEAQKKYEPCDICIPPKK